MKNFIGIYLGTKASKEKWMTMDPTTRQEKQNAGVTAWHNWVQKNEKSIVDHGSPLGKTKKVGPKGISDTVNEITAYTVVKAESHEAAAKLFLEHPHFMIFPGDSIEVLECLPIPTKG